MIDALVVGARRSLGAASERGQPASGGSQRAGAASEQDARTTNVLPLKINVAQF